MTENELLARIAELEAENAKLKEDAESQKHKKIAASLQYKFGDKYRWYRHIGGDIQCCLSKLVRSVCFEKVTKDRAWTNWKGERDKRKSQYVLQTKDMTKEQTELYYELCGKILGILDEHEVVSKEYYESTGRKLK